MGILGIDKVLEVVGDLGVEVLVLTLHAGDERGHGDVGDVAEVGGTDAEDGVLVEEEVQPRDLADGGEVVEGFVGCGDGAVKVVTLGHVAEGFGEGDRGDEVPGIWRGKTS